MKAFDQLIELAERRNSARSAWLKNVLTLAVGTLALLVALRPTHHLPPAQQYSLASSWVLLGLGILFGAGATYKEVDLATRLAIAFKDKMLETMEEFGTFDVASGPITAQAHWVWRFCQVAMCVCLSLAVVSLVTFAILTTFQT